MPGRLIIQFNYLMYGFCLLAFLVASGCGLVDIKEQIETADNTGTLKGNVKINSTQKGSVVAVRFRDNNGVLILKDKKITSSQGEYLFEALPGEHAVFVFIDVNNDGKFQRGIEHGNYHTNPLTVKVAANQTVKLRTLVIDDDPPLPPTNIKIEIDQAKISKNIGKVTSFEDTIFSRDYYSMGMWRPIDFLEQIGGGLMMLQEYERQKTPVIFVHGINGGPTDFKNMISSLDGQHFQPWILYYPSGLRLDVVSDYFVQAIQKLSNLYGFDDFIVVAHSMGGLVTRSFVKKYTERFPEYEKNIQLVMTINSPMTGMPSAASGLKLSLIVVPSWRDVATNSDFLKNIHNWDWPSHIPYFLIFSYKDGEADDGVVALNSQTPFKLQSEAEHMYGFNNNHIGTLSDKGFLSLFKSILAEHIK